MSGRNYMVAESDRDKLSLMKKKKKDFDYMTSSVLMEHQKNLLASLHFKACYDQLLFIPSIGITLGTGILAVLAQSGLYPDRTQSIFTLCIAILASFSVFWQSFMKQLDYGGRASLHDSAATALSHILSLAEIRSREQQITERKKAFSRSGSTDLESVEEGVPVTNGVTNQAGSGNIIEEVGNVASVKSTEVPVVDGEDHSTLSKQFEQAMQGCTSVVPIRITAAFDALESRINVCNKRLVPSGNVHPKIAWEKVYPALYHQLTLNIIGSTLWPYRVPDAKWAVEKTIMDFQAQEACLLKVLVKRTQVIDDQYNSLSLAASETTPLFSALHSSP